MKKNNLRLEEFLSNALTAKEKRSVIGSSITSNPPPKNPIYQLDEKGNIILPNGSINQTYVPPTTNGLSSANAPVGTK